ncbi:MAG: transglutaminase domain-containing protein [Syntrophales bacterium]
MESITVFPDKPITDAGPVSQAFLALGITTLREACRSVRALPYGHNSNRDDLLILFKEKMGTCTTKHAVIATLARELGLPIRKHVGIYAMTEELVTGTGKLLAEFDLPYIPMLHCFLVYEQFRVDLTEGNRNGKNRAIEEFLFIAQVEPNISSKDEYLLYRKALREVILIRPELRGVDLKRILHAREAGLKLLTANLLDP